MFVCLFFLGWVLQNHSIWDCMFCLLLLRFLLLVKNVGECLIIDWYCYCIPLFYSLFFPSIFVPYYLDFSHSWFWQEYQFHNFSIFFFISQIFDWYWLVTIYSVCCILLWFHKGPLNETDYLVGFWVLDCFCFCGINIVSKMESCSSITSLLNYNPFSNNVKRDIL